METPKANGSADVIIVVLLTAILVGGIAYVVFRNRLETTQEDTDNDINIDLPFDEGDEAPAEEKDVPSTQENQ